MGKIVFFLRVSTIQQSLDSQYDSLLAFATSYLRGKDAYYINGIPKQDIIKIEYKESGKKLREEERKGIQDFKNLCESGETISYTFVWEISRIARDAEIVQSFSNYLKYQKIQLVCAQPNFELLNDTRTEKTFTANLVLSIFSALAEQELIEKKERFHRGKEKLAKEQRYNGGRIPFGYMIDKSNNNKIVVNEDEAAIIHEIFNLYEKGLSQEKIANELTLRGIQPRQGISNINRISTSFIHQILTNIFLTGLPHKSKYATFERKYPPIISKQQFDNCRKIANSSKTDKAHTHNIYYAHNLIVCKSCGAKFTSTGTKCNYHCRDAYEYNKESKGYRRTEQCDNKLSISINIVDSLLWQVAIDYEVLFIMHSSESKIHEYQEKIRIIDEKIKAIPERLAELGSKRERLEELYYDGMTRPRYLEKKEKIHLEEQEILMEQTTYFANKERFIGLIAETKKSLDDVRKGQTEEEIQKAFDSYSKKQDYFFQKIGSITDDEERYEIIHRRISRVEIENTTIIYTFKKYPTGKEVKAKKITIYPFDIPTNEVYYYVPFDGKGGTMLKEYSVKDKSISLPILGQIEIPNVKKIKFNYLNRFQDNRKKERRKKQKDDASRKHQQVISSLNEKGFVARQEALRYISETKLIRGSKDGIINTIREGRNKFYNKEDILKYSTDK